MVLCEFESDSKSKTKLEEKKKYTDTIWWVETVCTAPIKMDQREGTQLYTCKEYKCNLRRGLAGLFYSRGVQSGALNVKFCGPSFM